MTTFDADKATDKIKDTVMDTDNCVKNIQWFDHYTRQRGLANGLAKVDEALIHGPRKLEYAYSMMTTTDIPWTEEELAEAKRLKLVPPTMGTTGAELITPPASIA